MTDTRVMIAGATGLVGGRFFEAAVADPDYSEIVLLGRRAVPELDTHEKVSTLVTDFSGLEAMAPSCKVDAVVCALGTTIKKAGSKERLFEIDCLYTEAAASYARRCGAKTLVAISSVGASPAASSHYLHTKGEMEKRVTSMGFESCHILRPSLLMGDRKEKRFGESLGVRLLSSLSFLIPAKYRPIHADTLARKIDALLKDPGDGVVVHEGKALGGY